VLDGRGFLCRDLARGPPWEETEAVTDAEPGLVTKEDPAMANVSVRYLVHDVDEAIEFYERLGFEVVMHPAPPFAMLQREGLRLLLNVPGGGGGGGQALDSGTPEPGGWNRFQLEVDDIQALVGVLRSQGVPFRSDIIDGIGGRQILAEDPSGNPVELFEPAPQ
jgi:catechol 2,3-dioxygenase-like lactoylglutathione lyase family enzyme